MVNVFTKVLLVLILLLTALPTTAQAESRGHPDLAAKADRIKRISLLPPQIDMYEIGAGGSLEKMDEWEQAANSNIRNALMTEFAKREQHTVTEFDERRIPDAARPTYSETLLLYNLVSNAILSHAFKLQYAPPTVQSLFFPEKAREFTYSLGKEVADLDFGVDAFLIIRGFDQQFSAGRKALNVGTALIGAVLGGVVVVPGRGGSLFTAALVDAKTGDILWFSESHTPHDLREIGDALKLAIEFMMDLPIILGQTPSG